LTARQNPVQYVQSKAGSAGTMADVDKLIEQILSNSKFAPKAEAEGKLYRDEPIIFTAKKLEGLTPPQYREMRRIGTDSAARLKSTARIFYEQARFMEDFEDDFDFKGEFARYFPTYEVMNLQELRGYFSWRTKWRRGQAEKTQTSFAFVYIYELLNQIGVKSPEAGFFALKDFWLAFRDFDYQLDRYVETWLRDYVVYNRLDKALLAEFAEVNFDQALLVLLDYKARTVDEVFAALNSVSSYNLENSRFFKQRPEEFREIACDIFAQYSEHYDKKCRKPLFQKLFGQQYTTPYYMFQTAVFYDKKPREDFVYEINPIYKYVYKRSKAVHWACERFFGFKAKNK
jgi:hypothetical protein